MGEAKRRRQAATGVVYHHTSTLCTNLIWMSGVIQVEDHPDCHQVLMHPDLGKFQSGQTSLRRATQDFPGVAWFTTRIQIPKCLMEFRLRFTGEDPELAEAMWQDMMPRDPEKLKRLYNTLVLNRIALGFPIADVPVIPWPQYYGYSTAEGRELNETARDAGDNPDDWYVSEQPVDVMKACEFWISPSKAKPKLERFDQQLKSIRTMVTTCRTRKDAYIAPSWITEDQAKALAARVDVPVQWGDGRPLE